MVDLGKSGGEISYNVHSGISSNTEDAQRTRSLRGVRKPNNEQGFSPRVADEEIREGAAPRQYTC